MNRTRQTIAALSAVSLAGMLWLWQTTPDTNTPHDPTTTESAPAQRTALAPAGVGASPDGVGVVEASLAAWRALHAPVGYLSQEDTEALIEQREQAAADLAAAIAALRGEELEGLLADFHAADRSRDKLVMIDGLGQNPSSEALSILEEIYTSEGSYTLKSNVLRALGDSPADGHHELLVEQMWSATDERLQQLSAQGLYGEGVASEAMIEAVHSTLPIKVRLEAIHSLGATGSDVAREALEEIAQDAAMEARVRQYAEKELGRSFG